MSGVILAVTPYGSRRLRSPRFPSIDESGRSEENLRLVKPPKRGRVHSATRRNPKRVSLSCRDHWAQAFAANAVVYVIDGDAGFAAIGSEANTGCGLVSFSSFPFSYLESWHKMNTRPGGVLPKALLLSSYRNTAERVGFEPTIPLRVYHLSRVASSTAPAPLQCVLLSITSDHCRVASSPPEADEPPAQTAPAPLQSAENRPN